MLYSLAVEQGLGKKVFARAACSTRRRSAASSSSEIPINDYTRGQGLQVLEIIDRAVGTGFRRAAPAERACTWCDFRPVCGPREEERIERKGARTRWPDLEALRVDAMKRHATIASDSTRTRGEPFRTRPRRHADRRGGCAAPARRRSS